MSNFECQAASFRRGSVKPRSQLAHAEQPTTDSFSILFRSSGDARICQRQRLTRRGDDADALHFYGAPRLNAASVRAAT
jgi:hypothetical protein